jgi:SAM-dependent methyltransferase
VHVRHRQDADTPGEQGCEVWGFDRSHSMLDRLTAKMEHLDDDVQSRVSVHHADMRTFQCPRRYRLIVVPFNAFLHLLERDGQEAALRNVAEHLEDGGRFVISFFNPRLDRPEELVRHRETKTMLNGETVSRFEAQTFDRKARRTTVHYFIDISRQDRELRRVTACFTIRYMPYLEALERWGRAPEGAGDLRRLEFRPLHRGKRYDGVRGRAVSMILDLDHTLGCGQVFRWRKEGRNGRGWSTADGSPSARMAAA